MSWDRAGALRKSHPETAKPRALHVQRYQGGGPQRGNIWKRSPSRQPRDPADQGRKRARAKLAFTRSQQSPLGAWTSPGLDSPASAPPWMPSPRGGWWPHPPCLQEPEPSHSQPVLRFAGWHQKQARDSVNNLTMWTVRYDTVVFGRRAWCLAVGHAIPTRACSAHASAEQSNFVQTSHGPGKRAVPKGT